MYVKSILLLPNYYESLAQSVEHLTFNQGVEGSSPSWLTILLHARVAELADALDLGSSVSRRGGSSPSTRIGFADVAQR